jgi:hypothetical protein
MDLRQARQQWQALHDAWAEAQVEAQSARSLCMARFRAGEGPTPLELDQAELLEVRADELRDRMDEFTGQYLGD